MITYYSHNSDKLFRFFFTLNILAGIPKPFLSAELLLPYIYIYVFTRSNPEFPFEGNFYATSSRGRYGNASSVTGYLKHD